jgi:hypothetical protein
LVFILIPGILLMPGLHSADQESVARLLPLFDTTRRKIPGPAVYFPVMQGETSTGFFACTLESTYLKTVRVGARRLVWF